MLLDDDYEGGENLRVMVEKLGKLLQEKRKHYGQAHFKGGEVLKLLYPNGMQTEDYCHALMIARIFEKCTRIASPNRNLDAESPYFDIAGYGIIGLEIWEAERKKAQEKEIAESHGIVTEEESSKPALPNVRERGIGQYKK